MIRPDWFILPDLFTSRRIERTHICLPWRTRCLDIPCPGIRRRARRDEVYAAAFCDGHVEVLGIGTVGRRGPVRCPRRGWAGHRSAHGWIVTWYDDWPSPRVKTVRPVHLTDKRSTEQKLAVDAVKNVIEAVAIGLKQQLTGLTFEYPIDQHQGFG